MTVSKPFHRNVRGIKSGPNSGYSGWAYIEDRQYAKNPEHFVRALQLIQNDLQSIFEFVEPSNEGKSAYSYRIHALFMRTCIEIEANFKAIFDENTFTPPKNRSLNMMDYRKIDASHHLSSYRVMLPIWNGTSPIWTPFEAWRARRGQSNQGVATIAWYKAYNASKHDRHEAFKQANFENLVNAVAGLLVVVTSQFKRVAFSAGSRGISLGKNDYFAMEPSIGSLFRIEYPTDWSDSELYEFDWSQLSAQPDRFQKFDYDSVPY